MARFAIDARVITGERDGIGRYARELLPALSAAAPADEFLVLRHPSCDEPLASTGSNVREVYVEGRVGTLLHYYLRDHVRLRRVFDAEGWPDLYHGLFHMSARAFPRQPSSQAERQPPAAAERKPFHAWRQPSGWRCPVVLTLHDLIWLDHPLARGSVVGGLGTWIVARTAIVGSLRQADHVIAVSDATAGSAARWLPRERMTVVHHGVPAAFRQTPPPLPEALRRLAADGRPWVAAAAGAKKYKNLPLLIDAFGRATRNGVDARLVLMGACQSLAALARRLGVGDRIVFAGEVGDDVLSAVMKRASLFVHPALVEGFGLPVVEAMAVGTPTAVADTPALTEVGGDGVMAFDPRDAAALAAIIERVLASAEVRQEWSARATARSRCFDWRRTAAATLDVYRQVLQDRRA